MAYLSGNSSFVMYAVCPMEGCTPLWRHFEFLY